MTQTLLSCTMSFNGSRRHLVFPSEMLRQWGNMTASVIMCHGTLAMPQERTDASTFCTGASKDAAWKMRGNCGMFVNQTAGMMGQEGMRAGSNSYRPYFQLARGERPTMCIDFRSWRKGIRFCFPDLLFVVIVAIFFFLVSICLRSFCT